MSSLLPHLLHWLHEYGSPVLWLTVFMAAISLSRDRRALREKARANRHLYEKVSSWIRQSTLRTLASRRFRCIERSRQEPQIQLRREMRAIIGTTRHVDGMCAESRYGNEALAQVHFCHSLGDRPVVEVLGQCGHRRQGEDPNHDPSDRQRTAEPPPGDVPTHFHILY
jgi:hypothetical protein